MAIGPVQLLVLGFNEPNFQGEILAELDPYFVVRSKRFFPLPFLPLIFCNLCIGLALEPRPVPSF